MQNLNPKKNSLTDGYFVSYAQNYEDIYLKRIFAMVKKGFYIDAGGFDPVLHSVTKNLYDSGWHGINIEPDITSYKKFISQRPRDINLNLAVSNKQGSMQMTSVMGFNSIDTDFIKKRFGHIPQKIENTVEVDTLNNIIESHPIPKDIHLLKIDVEGHEQQVLEGINLNRYRPWLIMFEHPCFNDKLELLIEDESFEIHTYLNKHNYQYAYHDGINFYYFSKESAALKSCFLWPVNIIDQFLPHREVNLINAIEDLNKLLEVEEDELSQQKLAEIKAKIKLAKKQYLPPPLFKNSGWQN